ncbi:ATP:cob(I)alamin adenosyltransferase [Methylovorus glucosotrophus]|uniref:cob(I)yrinic acid a,c-diamide adenosyltransferase n=1 Tax=Methylovorus glucosotrophus TaxID=266009 RepID=UPI0013311941|nr:cob(I)yrinic acid a,c-diamide adenosyltransferase [Methylovorus glucosotrophus]KAF0843367.1 ATP:cob(I)alamin adenosyltransferase [Methylovorus glucosotrophus]
MGNRLSKIYTRTGDEGDTGLGDGSRIAKDSLRVNAMGTVDELNAIIGILLTESLPADIASHLTRIQHDLFDLGGELCIPGHSMVKAERVDDLEHTLDALNEHLSPLKEFILPGGSRAAAYCHLARTVCRRAEREVVELSRTEQVTPIARSYLNRLSDLLFVLCRYLNKVQGVADVLWQNDSRQ